MRTWTMMIAASAVVLACAHKPQPEEVQLSPNVSVVVENTLNPPVQVSVFIVPATGGRQVLGTVSPGQSGRFSYQPTSASQQFQLVAQASSGRTLTSPPFTLVNVVTATWNLDQNLVRFSEP